MLPSDIEIEEYLDATGDSPFGDWFAGLDPIAAAKVTVAIARVARGATSNLKGVGDGLIEYRSTSVRATGSTSPGPANGW